MRQTSVHDDAVFPMPVKSFTVELISFGSVDTVRLGSESTQCIHPKHVCAWKPSSVRTASELTVDNSEGISSVILSEFETGEVAFRDVVGLAA